MPVAQQHLHVMVLPVILEELRDALRRALDPWRDKHLDLERSVIRVASEVLIELREGRVTAEADRRLRRVLLSDPGTGVMRHADAGYAEALDAARPALDGFDLSSLRIGISGGAPIPAEVIDGDWWNGGQAVTGAVRLYERAGFAVAGRRERYYRQPSGEQLNALLMRRDLS